MTSPRAAQAWPLSFAGCDGFERSGLVRAVSRRLIRVAIPGLALGAGVEIEPRGRPSVIAEVIDIDGPIASCAPLVDAHGVVAGSNAHSIGARIGAFAGDALLGHDTDAWGRCEASPSATVTCGDDATPIETRRPITRPLHTGTVAIDAFATLGYGQRIALFAGAGVGKTTLLRSIIDRAVVDARVVALVGERGREAAELIESLRGDRRRESTTVVCATADASPIERLAALRTASAHARALASGGRDVLLVVDSLTRAAAAWREIALSEGEPAAHRGHPPSLAALLASLVERAGAWSDGSVTGIYSVLVDGDDVREPVTDSVRGLLDGHIVLSRRLAESGSFPAIDVLRSLSRLMPAVATLSHRADASTVCAALSTLEQAEDLLAVGAYQHGGDAALDNALAAREDIEKFLFRPPQVHESTMDSTLASLASIAAKLRWQAPPPKVARRKSAAPR